MIFLIIYFSEDQNGDVWYYSSEDQFNELMETIDQDKWECDLMYGIEEYRRDILRQMSITESLTNSHRATRKSVLQVEAGMEFITYYCILLFLLMYYYCNFL